MDVWLATWLVRLLGVYAGLGVLFAVPFALRWVNRMDPEAVGGTWGFRLLILPGAALFWPLLLARLLRGAGPPTEQSPHRAGSR